MRHHVRVTVLVLLYITLQSRAKILRNNALMTKMISHFQQDNNLSAEPQREDKRRKENPQNEFREQKQDVDIINKENLQNHQPEKILSLQNHQPEKILSLMQNVLCRNFPSIPCNIIMQDQALNQLIQRSIQQITYKKLQMDQTTPALSRTDEKFSKNSPTLYPIINSEDLSNFLEVSNTGFFDETGQEVKRKKKKAGSELKVKNHWSHEKPSKKKVKGSKDTKRGTELFSGRKKMRKFYPHKIKYKDKNTNNGQTDFIRDYDTNEKVSMSAEMPDMPLGMLQNREHLAYKVEAADSPIWRIDYMKHGEPSTASLNMFGFADNRLTGKLVKNSGHTQAVVADENGLEQPVVRKDVLHPDVYIKKNFVRRNTNSEILE